MKPIIILFVICAASPDIINGAGITQEIIYECMRESGATEEMLKSIRLEDKDVPEDMQCFNECLGIKMKILNEDGSLNIETYSRMLPPNFPEDQRKKKLEECTAITGLNDCYTAHNLLLCIGVKYSFEFIGKRPPAAITECVKEMGVDLRTIKAAGANSSDKNVKCFYTCVLKKQEFMNEDGTVNKDGMLKASVSPHHSPERREVIMQILQQCSEIIGNDECDTGYKIAKCIRPLITRPA